MLIFPEGTCTNGQALIKFKSGAFQVCMLDTFFRQIKSFLRFRLVFVFGLQTLLFDR